MASTSQSTSFATGMPGDLGSSTSIGSLPTDETLNRIVQGAHEAVDRLAEKAAPAVERLRTGFSGAADTLQSSAAEFNALQEKWVENARGYVREHPLASVGMAVAAGYLLSRLTAR